FTGVLALPLLRVCSPLKGSRGDYWRQAIGGVAGTNYFGADRDGKGYHNQGEGLGDQNNRRPNASRA
ncbi:unnamed protein product, partial [Ectocarpus sp. 13 AM-2016]